MLTYSVKLIPWCVEFISLNNLPNSKSHGILNTTICLFRLNIHNYVDVTDTFSFKTFECLCSVLMCSSTNPTCHVHLNYPEVHLWRYLFNGHTALHVCLMQLHWVIVECIVHICCIILHNKCSVCFVLTKLNTQLKSA